MNMSFLLLNQLLFICGALRLLIFWYTCFLKKCFLNFLATTTTTSAPLQTTKATAPSQQVGQNVEMNSSIIKMHQVSHRHLRPTAVTTISLTSLHEELTAIE